MEAIEFAQRQELLELALDHSVHLLRDTLDRHGGNHEKAWAELCGRYLGEPPEMTIPEGSNLVLATSIDETEAKRRQEAIAEMRRRTEA